MLERLFKIRANGTSVKTELLAGLTTFMTMAYILAVNPDILSAAGMDKNAVFTATALSAAIASVMMALFANLPFALAPGMGLNAFFAFTVVVGMGYSWQLALTAVFIEGIVFVILTFFNIRELIVNSIPSSLKHAISTGIGLFIAFIGLQKAGIIVKSDSVLVGLGDMRSPVVFIALGGLILTGVLLALKVRGALLIGIFVATLAGIPFGLTEFPKGSLVALPPSIEPVFMKFDFAHLWSSDMLVVLFTFLFINMFDTVGTLVGVATKAGMVDKNGNILRVKQALFADATGTVVGAMLGTSTVTTYAESAAGVAEGGKTGLTAVATGGLFVLALFFAPLFMMVPASATTPALIIVGFYMMSLVREIDFDDYTEALPAFLTILMMPLAYSIAKGIAFGMVSYVLLKVFSGKFRDVSWTMAALAVIFILKFIF
jgi:adenine/guanine/hypoxanthine permease